jgi:hypothetical protein
MATGRCNGRCMAWYETIIVVLSCAALHHIRGMLYDSSGIPNHTPMEALSRAFADALAHFLQSY